MPLDDGRVLLKRGLRELVVGGPGVVPLVQELVALLDGSRTAEEVLDEFPPNRRASAANLLGALADRSLLRPRHATGQNGSDDPQLRFYGEFTASPGGVLHALSSSRVLLAGSNRLAESLARSLGSLGVGTVATVAHPGLDSGSGDASRPGSPALDGVSSETWDVVIAASDFGEATALLDLSRAALEWGRPFLPVWIANLVGFVGPLTYPFETACLRCYRLRCVANNPNHPVAHALGRYLGGLHPAERPVALLPPMVEVTAGIAALEAAKALTRFVPCDAVGRVIEINLVSFGTAVRRVVKLPRCPDCSDVMDTAAAALTRGPGLPQR